MPTIVNSSAHLDFGRGEGHSKVLLVVCPLSWKSSMATKILTTRTRAGILTLANLQLSTKAASSPKYDLAVVGGGILGVASAREILLRHPKTKIVILEKEKKLAFHQSGRNSGVIHAGIYYKPGSLMAKLCVQGLGLMYQYCDEKKIPYKKVGKLIVATNDVEVTRLMDLYERGKQNQVPDLQLIDENKIEKIEPYCQGVKALWSPHTGIVDYRVVTESYANDFKQTGGDIYLKFNVIKFDETPKDAEYPVTISSADGQSILVRHVLTCSGLQSDRVAGLTGCSREPRILPVRGEYLLLNKEKCHMIKGNIYPVPDPRFPFLGVHFTPRMDGSVWMGPNAVVAFKREGYRWFDVNLFELLDTIRYSGFLRLASKFYAYGLKEMVKSAVIPLQMRELQKYIPEIIEVDVSRGPSGVRAQALAPNGDLVNDFVFDRGAGSGSLAKHVLHCRNAPSPGATSSLAIAKMIADRIESEFEVFK